jgi:putative transcriptional regulator
MGSPYYSRIRSFLSCAAMVLRQNRRAMTTMRTRIKELRARYNLTQEELAKKVGVRRETILFIEKGRYNPSLKLAHDIAKALQTTIDDLFIFEEA